MSEPSSDKTVFVVSGILRLFLVKTVKVLNTTASGLKLHKLCHARCEMIFGWLSPTHSYDTRFRTQRATALGDVLATEIAAAFTTADH